jgi:lipid-A-disaccharide synthase
LNSRLLLSCGEPSGDLYAGALTRELLALAPDLSVAGLGGPHLAQAGGTLVADYRGLAVTGLTEVVANIPRYAETLRRLVAWAEEHRPSALVVIDFVDFNFRLARRIKKLGIPIIYYISPQIWAWRGWRLETIRTLTDRMLVIFPFEEEIYRRSGVPVEFVGHPLVDLAQPSAPRESFLANLGLDPGAQTIAILPGSRRNEVHRILPDLVAAARQIHERLPATQFVVARAPHLDDDLFEPLLGGQQLPHRIVEGQTDSVLASADLALTASGTATIQCALHDTPMIVVYRLSPLTYRLGRRFVTVAMYAMVNLVGGERIVPELIQRDFTPDAVRAEAIPLLTDQERRNRMRAGLAEVRKRLGAPGASRRAAEAVLRMVQGGHGVRL